MWPPISKAPLGLALAVCLGAAACGGGPLAGGGPGDSSSPVPSNVQQAVQQKYGSLAFVPTRVPDGYAFRSWGGGATSFGFTFGPDQTQEIQFGVDEVSCSSAGSSMHTFEENGVAVEWSATDEDQQAWRCLTVDGTQVLLISNRSVPGDGSLDTPAQLQDAQQLVELVAYAQTIQ